MVSMISARAPNCATAPSLRTSSRSTRFRIDIRCATTITVGSLEQKSLQQAALAISILPVVLVFLALQRLFVASDFASGVK